MKKRILIGILCLFVAHLTVGFTFAAEKKENKVRNAVVKIHTVSSDPDYFSPWKQSDPAGFSGSGAIIKGERILTNAHVVSNQKYIQVQPYGSPQRYNAEVQYVSHESDLAILTVDDKDFFTDRAPLKIGGLPETLQEVLVYGYPTGGDSLSITKGILSRIVYDMYVHSDHYFISGQIDAAINPGNSGGPVIVDGKIVGVVMQGLNGSDIENIGYTIPSPVINHFLTDIEDGVYNGFPEPGFISQSMDNSGMRRQHMMGDDDTGVLITHVFWNSKAKDVLQKGDVVLEIDGHDVANDQTIELRDNERIFYMHYSDMHQLGEEIKFKILRDGVVKDVKYELHQTSNDLSLVPGMLYDESPKYFIFGGVVFSTLTENLICEWSNCNGPAYLLSQRAKYHTEERQEVIVVLQVLPSEVNRGYHNTMVWVIDKVNGEKFKDFEEFYSLVANSVEPFVVFEDDTGGQMVIDREMAEQNHAEILETYNVKTDRSAGFE